MKAIKNFLIGLKTSWLYRLYLVAGILLLTSTYTGQVMDTRMEYTWYSDVVYSLMVASILYLAVFTVVLLGIALYNTISNFIKGKK